MTQREGATGTTSAFCSELDPRSLAFSVAEEGDRIRDKPVANTYLRRTRLVLVSAPARQCYPRRVSDVVDTHDG
jgi:hypothetical protein